jgi:hypothetical protein
MNTVPPHTSLTLRWQWLPWGYASQYDLEAKLAPERLPELAQLLLTQLLPQAARSHQTILDQRGRDPWRESLLPSTTVPPPQGEELFFLSGTRPCSATDSDPDAEPLPEHFELGYYTAFSHFEGPSHIAYAVKRVQRGAEEAHGGELALILDPSTQISAVRLGIEIFEPRFLSIFGFSPIATQLVQIEALPGVVRLRLSGEGLRQKDSFPLKAGTLAATVTHGIQELLAFDILRDISAHLAREGEH